MAWTTINNRFQCDAELIKVGTTDRLRPKAIRGYIGGGKMKRTHNTCLVAKAPNGGDDDSKILHTEGGHLIALELGGADHYANLAPMYGSVNRGTYRALEKDVPTALAGKFNCAMYVRMSYSSSLFGDNRVPTKFEVFLLTGVTNLSAVDPGTSKPWRTIMNTKATPSFITISDKDDIQLRKDLMKVKAQVGTDWKIEDELEGAKFVKGFLPDGARPNAWLDYLIYMNETSKIARKLLSKVPSGTFTVAKFTEFAHQQRLLVAAANMFTQPDEKKGQCWSDAGKNDPIKTALTQLGTDDGIQIDHIFPKASGGPNIYSNAAVTSALFNKSKGRTIK